MIAASPIDALNPPVHTDLHEFVRYRKKMEMSKTELLIATRNSGKTREFRELLQKAPVILRSLDDFPEIGDVEESGTTFEENASLKAAEYAKRSGILTAADDSGLEVAALGGLPGVRSARFGGASANYDAKMSLLLDSINAVGGGDRRARFVSVIALALPSGEVIHLSRGECEGVIAFEPRGGNGFGYDPIFIPNGLTRTFGELPDSEKSQISHRAKATATFIRYLLDFIGL